MSLVRQISFASLFLLAGLILTASFVESASGSTTSPSSTIRSGTFTQDCLDLAANLGVSCGNSTASALTTGCCQAVSTFNQRGCFCNGAVTSQLPPEALALLASGFGPTLLKLCAPNATTVIQPSAKNCPAEATTPGVCGVPDWEIDGLRLGFFALLLTNATDSLGHYVPQNADLGALFAPYFTANSTVVVPSIEGSYQGPEDIRELLTFALSNFNDESSFVAYNFFGAPKFSGPDTVLGNISVTTIVPAPTKGPALLSSQSSSTLINVTFDSCSAKVKIWVENFSAQSLYIASKGRPSDVDLCGKIQNLCQGNLQQYDSVMDCVNFFDTLPERSCVNQVLSGNCKSCRFLHYVLAKSNPDLHCFHVGKGGPDPNGHLKCQDSLCTQGLTPEALTANSTRAIQLKQLANSSA